MTDCCLLLRWGFAPLASAPFGVSCCGGYCCYATAGTAEGRAHKKTTTQQYNKRAASLGWGFAPLAALHAGEESRRQHNHQHNHQHIGGFCPRRCRR